MSQEINSCQTKSILVARNQFLPQEINSCHRKSILVTRNQFLLQEINSCHKKSFLVKSHPSIKLFYQFAIMSEYYKKFACSYTFRGNLVPRFPKNSPPWARLTEKLGSKNKAVLKKQLSKPNLNSTQLKATLRGVVRIEN